MGKWLVIIGTTLLLTGLLIMALGRFFEGGKLPGDIIVKRENFTFYFPLATSVLISIILSLVIYLINKLR